MSVNIIHHGGCAKSILSGESDCCTIVCLFWNQDHIRGVVVCRYLLSYSNPRRCINLGISRVCPSKPATVGKGLQPNHHPLGPGIGPPLLFGPHGTPNPLRIGIWNMVFHQSILRFHVTLQEGRLHWIHLRFRTGTVSARDENECGFHTDRAVPLRALLFHGSFLLSCPVLWYVSGGKLREGHRKNEEEG